MKTRILIAATALMISGVSIAQDSRFSTGLEVAIPVGDFGEFQGIGFGVTLGYEIPVGNNLGVLAQAGYIYFTGKTVTIDLGPLGSSSFDGPSIGAIPIQVGAKYYFTDNQEGVYLGLMTGIHLWLPEEGDSRTNFGIAPMLGFMVTENIDIALRFQMLFDSYDVVDVDLTTGQTTTRSETQTNSYIGLRAAYMF